MKAIPIHSLVDACRGSLSRGELTGQITSVSTDTRAIVDGAAFVALRGDHFDGHAFLDQAIDQGAKALIVDHLPEGFTKTGIAVVVVDDTLRALQSLAAWHLKEANVEVVGITGSNGKTSTKDFTKAVLQQKYQVHATAGNFNNHIGLPLTILSMPEETEVCVLEMGMSGHGEIAALCEIARPRIGVITNIGTAHIEYLGSREAIATEKGALVRYLPANGVLCLSAVCDFADHYCKQTKSRVIIVGNGRGKIRAEKLAMSKSGSSFHLVSDEVKGELVTLPVVGRHMVSNALLAAAVGKALGMTLAEIADGLNAATLTSGRLRSFISGEVQVFDDTYNANPESMKAAIEALDELELATDAERYAVLGKMAELGEYAETSCESVGSLAAKRRVELVTVGQEAKPISDAALKAGGAAYHFDDQAVAAEWLKDHCKANDAVLFKGSRSAKMEEVMRLAFPQN
ncbi:UDP-N-acetylmuramoyl-tripeptide--D-alanyl-D-alanine ligase [Rubritalea marina]|uniref:UDP-N-acetylmuramoyl-tripeptide--D-alanyl-D- alanine ligase n=1 Tax=Rubritalea marina TaxID=361055 RepID=UPI000375C178|nr:UDP-N-acetylmuramoyl-tripeptide--D-alanyl-D-alanine ligase [Rubritalea marina]